jgi:hypothetical protein
VIRFGQGDGATGAVVDLSKAYPDVNRAWRGIALADRGELLVRDEIAADEPVEIVWHLHTGAEVATDGRHATLTQGDRRLLAEIIEPDTAQFIAAGATTPPPQRPLNHVRRLSIRVPQRTSELSLVVVLKAEAESSFPPIWRSRPLNNWPSRSHDPLSVSAGSPAGF